MADSSTQDTEARCPYCGEDRDRQECISDSMARHVLPACASGPRNDASDDEKRQFRSWLKAKAQQ